MFLWLIIQLLMIIKLAHKILSLTHRKGRGINPIYEYFLHFYRRINMAVLNSIGVKSFQYHLPLQQEIWLVFNSRSNLIGVTYIHTFLIHWSTEPWSTEPPASITYPTHRLRDFFLFFFYQKITQKGYQIFICCCSSRILSVNQS